MADIDRLTQEVHLLKMLSENEGLDIVEAAAIVGYAIKSNCSISDSIIAVLGDEEGEEEEVDDSVNQQLNNYINKAMKDLTLSYIASFPHCCCKKLQ